MSFNRQLGDEELAFYTLHLLDEQEAAAVAHELAGSEDLRQRLARVQAVLAAYAESLDLMPVPEGSIDRLMGRIAAEKTFKQRQTVLAFPHKTPSQPAANKTGLLLAWAGWAVAAGLAVVAIELYRQPRNLPQPVAIQQPAQQPTQQPVQQPAPPSVPTDLIEQRDALAADVADQSRLIQQLTAEASKARKDAETLRRTVAGESTKLQGQAEEMAQAQAERDSLRGTVAAQADQVTRLTSDAGQARQVMQTLTDPTALRVTLTKPKSHPTPTGRATYVASKGTLVFLASSLAPLRPDKVYQLWLLPADGSKPVPAGTFAPDARGNASVVYTQFPQAVTAKGFAVTIENQGGATAPTLPILLAGNA